MITHLGAHPGIVNNTAGSVNAVENQGKKTWLVKRLEAFQGFFVQFVSVLLLTETSTFVIQPMLYIYYT